MDQKGTKGTKRNQKGTDQKAPDQKGQKGTKIIMEGNQMTPKRAIHNGPI